METSRRDGFEAAVRVLLHGFDALRIEYQLLAEKYYKLEQEHAATVRQLKSARPDSPETSVHQQSTTVDDPPPRKLHEWLDQHRRQNDSSTTSSVPDIKKAELAHMKLQSLLHRAQVTQSYMSDIELDFTTPGNAGRLGCPFSRTRKGSSIASRDRLSALRSPPSHCPVGHEPSKDSNPEHVTSPLKVVEQCGIEAGNQPPPPPASNSALEPGAACPIRFLDQRSPEEIAQYVEEHKHQVPRSHEVCVKRFQDNSKSIQQLDAKYGSLVNMLQQLGVKHKSMLPGQAQVDDEHRSDERRSDPRVEKWARSVDDSLSRPNPSLPHQPIPSSLDHPHDPNEANDHRNNGNEDQIQDDRIPHFDRPLKEIRVGESPSRPWGISIPPQYMEQARSDTSPQSVPAPPLHPSTNHNAATHSPQKATAGTAPPPKGCPFHMLAKPQVAPADADADAHIPAPPEERAEEKHSRVETTSHARASTHSHAPSIPSSTSTPRKTKQQHGTHFINRGVAVLNSSSLFSRPTPRSPSHSRFRSHAERRGKDNSANFVFENYGTVFIDDSDSAMEFFRATALGRD